MAHLSIPELVAAIRKEAGLTQEALARELSVSFPTVNSWERGRSTPRAGHVQQLCAMADGLGITRELTVLVIDDDALSRATAEGFLLASPLPVTAVTVGNGSEGLVLCGVLQPDLLLLDVLMPGIDGVEVSQRLPSVPGLERTRVVFITSATDPEILDRVRATGHPILTKPLDRETVDELLAELAAGTAAEVPPHSAA